MRNDINLDFSSLANPATCPRLAVGTSRALGNWRRRWSLIHAEQELNGAGRGFCYVFGSDIDANVRDGLAMRERDCGEYGRFGA